MPSIEDNVKVWGQFYDWPKDGDEWSWVWGGAVHQWEGTIRPRIASLLPAGTILEIGCGHGRWSRFLHAECDKLILVDLNASCIEHCRQRFRDLSNIEYFVNDGKSLEMIPDQSVDFVFSFDSLVHVEADVVEAYLRQLARKLKPEGAGFFHHSNLGAYPRKMRFTDWAEARVSADTIKQLRELGWVIVPCWRGRTMTGARFKKMCEQSGLRSIHQELINWSQPRSLVDCFSIFVRKGSKRERRNRVVRNRFFMAEARRIGELSRQASESQSSAAGA